MSSRKRVRWMAGDSDCRWSDKAAAAAAVLPSGTASHSKLGVLLLLPVMAVNKVLWQVNYVKLYVTTKLAAGRF